VDTRVVSILNKIGANPYIGAPINMVENLLLIAARASGVQFLFDSPVDWNLIDKFDLVFDASGGNINWFQVGEYKPSKYQKNANSLRAKIHKKEALGEGYSNSGITNFGHSPEFSIDLKAGSDLQYWPTFDDDSIEVPMLKITSLPSEIDSNIISYIRLNNEDSKFYLWPGNLKPPINESLLLVNLSSKVFDFFKCNIISSQPMDKTLFSDGFLEREDTRLAVILKKLSELYGTFTIQPPFPTIRE
jgi:hypothetical protein